MTDMAAPLLDAGVLASGYSTPRKNGSSSRRGSNEGSGGVIPPSQSTVTSSAISAAIAAVQAVDQAALNGTHTHSPATATRGLIVSPPKFGRTLRARPLSRDTSKEALQQQAHADVFLPGPTVPASPASSASSSVAALGGPQSLTTTSIFSNAHMQPHPPGISPTHTVISSTTTFSPGGRSLAEDKHSASPVTLPSVISSSNASPSLTASLLAAANKDAPVFTSVQLPAIVSAQQHRLAALESLTHTQGESIIELQRTIRSLQKQLVFVMAAVPSTSGTGGVASLLSPSPPSARTLGLHGSPVEPHRSRSSTELRQRAGVLLHQQQQHTSRHSSGGHPADRIVSGLHNGTNHTDSMESLPHSHRSHKGSSRPTSKTNSRYSSPRNARSPHNNGAAGAAHGKASSHHFSFHPTTPMQPPPGQLHVDHSVGIVSGHSSARSHGKGRSKHDAHTPHPPSSQTLSPQRDLASSARAARRLSPVDGFNALGTDAAFAAAAAAANSGAAPLHPPLHHVHHTTHHTHAPAAAYPQHNGYALQQLQQQQAAYHMQQQQQHQLQQQQLYMQQQMQQHHHHASHHHASPAPASSSAAGVSVDSMRPLPVQTTVTKSRHGVTEYVLSFRDGGARPASPSGGSRNQASGDRLDFDDAGDDEHAASPPEVVNMDPSALYPELPGGSSPRSAALELWRAQQLQQGAALQASPSTKRDRRAKKSSAAVSGSTSIDMHGQQSSEPTPFDEPAAPVGVTAATLLAAKRARKKEREGGARKACKVAGCGEPRVGTDGKYCKAHSGPAPSNPNARKMMFQH